MSTRELQQYSHGSGRLGRPGNQDAWFKASGAGFLSSWPIGQSWGRLDDELIRSLVNNAGMVRGREHIGGMSRCLLSALLPPSAASFASYGRRRSARAKGFDTASLRIIRTDRPDIADADIDVMFNTNGELPRTLLRFSPLSIQTA